LRIKKGGGWIGAEVLGGGEGKKKKRPRPYC